LPTLQKKYKPKDGQQITSSLARFFLPQAQHRKTSPSCQPLVASVTADHKKQNNDYTKLFLHLALSFADTNENSDF
jgi:hypothetical protein